MQQPLNCCFVLVRYSRLHVVSRVLTWSTWTYIDPSQIVRYSDTQRTMQRRCKYGPMPRALVHIYAGVRTILWPGCSSFSSSQSALQVSLRCNTRYTHKYVIAWSSNTLRQPVYSPNMSNLDDSILWYAPLVENIDRKFRLLLRSIQDALINSIVLLLIIHNALNFSVRGQTLHVRIWRP